MDKEMGLTRSLVSPRLKYSDGFEKEEREIWDFTSNRVEEDKAMKLVFFL